MLSNHTTQWVDLREKYNIDDVINNDTTERTLPCITHVRIRNNVQRTPNETGVILHLIDRNDTYKIMSVPDFNLAKSNCRILLETYASTFKSELDELSSSDMTLDNRDRAINSQLSEIHKVAHEFLAILHHYQIHFSNKWI